MNTIPVHPTDPVNTAILSVAEDQVQGFHRRPLHFIARKSAQPLETVIERLKAMTAAGIVRRVRQTLLATKLAQGALIAWEVPEDKLHSAFKWMQENAPYTGHYVLSSTAPAKHGTN